MAVTDPGFSEAYPDLLGVAYRAAHRVTGDATVAEDVAAEALTRALLRWNRIADRAVPWVARVATNLAIDHLRSAGRRRRGAAHDRPESTGGDVDRRLDLHRALRALPRRQRQVVVLRYFGDLSEQEIAGELGLAPGTVKSHASRGLAALRAHLEDTTPTAPPPEVLR